MEQGFGVAQNSFEANKNDITQMMTGLKTHFLEEINQHKETVERNKQMAEKNREDIIDLRTKSGLHLQEFGDLAKKPLNDLI